VTVPAVSTPEVLIEANAEFSLHVGVTAVVLPSLHVAVAAYVPLPFSFTDEGPEIDRLDRVGKPGGGGTGGTVQENGGARDDVSPVFKDTLPVK
jgi:hypothetical protein